MSFEAQTFLNVMMPRLPRFSFSAHAFRVVSKKHCLIQGGSVTSYTYCFIEDNVEFALLSFHTVGITVLPSVTDHFTL